jgi:hypothetical protein
VVIQRTQNYNLPTGSTDTGVDINSGVRISKVCTVTTKEDTKSNQYSEHSNKRRKIQDNYHRKNKKVKSAIEQWTTQSYRPTDPLF